MTIEQYNQACYFQRKLSDLTQAQQFLDIKNMKLQFRKPDGKYQDIYHGENCIGACFLTPEVAEAVINVIKEYFTNSISKSNRDFDAL